MKNYQYKELGANRFTAIKTLIIKSLCRKCPRENWKTFEN